MQIEPEERVPTPIAPTLAGLQRGVPVGFMLDDVYMNTEKTLPAKGSIVYIYGEEYVRIECDNPHCSYVFCEAKGIHEYGGLRLRCPKCKSWKVV